MYSSFFVTNGGNGSFFHLHKIVEGLYFLSVCVCVSGTSCEQNSSRMDEPIWTRFSLNCCLLVILFLMFIGLSSSHAESSPYEKSILETFEEDLVRSLLVDKFSGVNRPCDQHHFNDDMYRYTSL